MEDVMTKIPIFACNDDGEQVRSYEVDGKEMPDSRPLELPVGAYRPPTLEDNIKRWLQHELMANAANSEGIDTFEEAGDFDIEDDPVDPHTPWEALFDPVPDPGPVGVNAVMNAALETASPSSPVPGSPKPGVQGSPPADSPLPSLSESPPSPAKPAS